VTRSAVGCIARDAGRTASATASSTLIRNGYVNSKGTVGTNMEGAAVTFDENYRVRVLAQDKYDKTLALADSATEFCEKVVQLNGIVKEVVESVDRQAARTEREKLRAVGKRNQVAADAEQRRRKKAELASLRLEKQAELDRLQAEYDSLLRVRQEQEVLIAKLSDSSS